VFVLSLIQFSLFGIPLLALRERLLGAVMELENIVDVALAVVFLQI